MSKFAWVTLATNDSYSLGSLVLAHSLRRVGTVHQLAVLVTPGVSPPMRDRLKEVYNVVQEVNVMDSEDAANLALLARPELGVTFTKLHCWRLVQFEKCVFLDSDSLVLKNCDELFEREELSAAPDVSWPDCFNSGVFVFRPSLDTFAKITEFAAKHGSFDGGDQGLLNLYFSDWATADIRKHLPFIYNVAAYAAYCYLPAFKQFKDKIKILHFAGKMKPWLIHFNSQTRKADVPQEYIHAADFIQYWWDLFFENVHQTLSKEMAGLAAALSQLRLGEERTPEQEAYEQLMRRQCWEAGQIDYTGRDSFENIWKKITQTMEAKPSSSSSPSSPDKSDRLASFNHVLTEAAAAAAAAAAATTTVAASAEPWEHGSPALGSVRAGAKPSSPHNITSPPSRQHSTTNPLTHSQQYLQIPPQSPPPPPQQRHPQVSGRQRAARKLK